MRASPVIDKHGPDGGSLHDIETDLISALDLIHRQEQELLAYGRDKGIPLTSVSVYRGGMGSPRVKLHSFAVRIFEDRLDSPKSLRSFISVDFAHARRAIDDAEVVFRKRHIKGKRQ